MKKTYNDEFEPDLYLNMNPSKYFMEIPRVCYQMKEFTKTDILVYSAIMAGMNSGISDIFSYSNEVIEHRIRIDKRQIRRSISKLEEMGIISVSRKDHNHRDIKLIQDLRIDEVTGKKNVIQVYDRIFYYPLITKPMVHVYSYYLSLSRMERYRNGCNATYETVAKSLGYSKKQIISILGSMEAIGLIHIERVGNQKTVKLLVDFSKEQPEEKRFLKEREKRLSKSEEEVKEQEIVEEFSNKDSQEPQEVREHGNTLVKGSTPKVGKLGKAAIQAYKEIERLRLEKGLDEWDDIDF